MLASNRSKFKCDLKSASIIHFPQAKKLEAHYPPLTAKAEKALIIGAGPAGIFAALRCIELGIQPILLERGKDASSRRFDLGPILKKGTVLENSNYCFGEGGAGTFSDGKLYTRSTKRGPIRKIYETLVAHGAPSQILVDAHPHIGSNLLPKVVMNLRKSILDAGGKVHFNTQITELLLDGPYIKGVNTRDQGAFYADTVILATGHSARDIYQILQRQQISLEQKAFALGVRIEHPQALIDAIQYKQAVTAARPRYLPAASYRLATKIDDRGVHSFCMCPGGFIVPASTENDAVVVNGMSLSRRDSPFANSGMVVSVEPEDTQHLQKEHGALAGIAFQSAIERSAKTAGGGQVAPAQRVTDFLAKRESASLPKTSYFPGIRSQRIDQLLPEWIVGRLSRGLELFGRQMKGYLTEECNLIGFESRTSSPVRIPRTHTHCNIQMSLVCTLAVRALVLRVASSAQHSMACAVQKRVTRRSQASEVLGGRTWPIPKINALGSRLRNDRGQATVHHVGLSRYKATLLA